MKILACISHVPDTTTKIQFSPDKSGINPTGVTFIIDPYGEYGLSRAIGFAEEGKQVHITALCVGGPEVDPTLRRALAIGAHEAVRIDVQAFDSAFTASQIAAYARDKGFDIIFTGKESIDFNGSLVPGMVAEYLGLPFVPSATHMEVLDGGKALLRREIDGGSEVVEVQLPAVVSCQKGIAEWRIPNMRGITSARSKPFQVAPAVEVAPFLDTLGYDYPPAKSPCQYFDAADASTLVAVLADKGLV